LDHHYSLEGAAAEEDDLEEEFLNAMVWAVELAGWMRRDSTAAVGD
jgi:hypothetical protein